MGPPDARLRRAVAIGGGHGLARSLRALTRIADDVTAVVTVADDGGSSGRLRRDLGVLPPGDLRMALAAMARRYDLAEVVQYRFGEGELAGHSLGNLVLVALQDLAGGDLLAALQQLGVWLEVPGRVVPCSPVPIVLHADTRAGHVEGQAVLTATRRIEKVWLEPAAPAACPAALEALSATDMVVLGPGSLFTSLLPNLLVPEIGAAVAASGAPVVLVTNLREQPGETEGLDLGDHLDVLVQHVPGLRLDAVVAHRGPSPRQVAAPLHLDASALAGRVGRVVAADLLDGDDAHDPARLAAALQWVIGGP